MTTSNTHGKKGCCAPPRAPGDAQPALDRPGPEPTPESQIPRVTRGDTRDMVQIPGGTFLVGTDDAEGFPDDGEGPIREVLLDPFWIDVHAVSNRHFHDFVRKTHYQTDAERFGWSFVFHLLLPPHARAKARGRGDTALGLEWWCKVDGASWRRPLGTASDLRKRMDHPVVHVSHADALAYCAWAGKRLPTEAEWEVAARGGLHGKRFAWGDELTPGGHHQCNIWQGRFPEENTADDGYVGTAPVFAFPPNGYGLYNMAGNVWEWCHDWWSATHHITGTRRNPCGPPTPTGRRSIRGGSYLCHHSYCNRYRVAARTSNTPDSSTGNMGFRTVRDV